MNNRHTALVSLATIAATSISFNPTHADVTVPSVFADHMVLQRGQEVPIWGMSDPGDVVTVVLGEGGGQHTGRAIADDDGRWMTRLGPFPANATPQAMTVSGGHNAITINDILIGEVWVCSGQSNMQWSVRASANPESERAAANWPQIRMFTAAHVTANEPQFTVPGDWKVCAPATVSNFSAVGYYFGRHLHQELGVPIGLLHTSWGGTRAEPWTSGDALANHPRYAEIYAAQRDAIDQFRAMSDEDREALYQDAKAAAESAIEAYWNRVTRETIGMTERWFARDVDTSDWPEMELPALWENAGIDELRTFDGFVWFTRTVEIPASWAGRDLRLELGKIDDGDITWFNGERVGRMFAWNQPRTYTVPAELVSEGVATITIMALDTGGAGGMNSRPAEMNLSLINNPSAERIALSGTWKYRTGGPPRNARPPAQPTRPREPGLGNQDPAALFNAMIHPIVPYGVQGAIWYQGESNANEAEAYRELLPLMIQSWRDAWRQASFPFGIVQLASFRPAAPNEPAQGGWAYLRDAQLHAAQTVDDTGLAIAIDIGEANDIHPKNKQDVGHRLALWALATVYDKDIEYAGPTYASMKQVNNTIELTFSHADGLTTRDGASPGGFAIAGADGVFHWADARIDGNRIIVSSEQVEDPVAVRYAWQNNPVDANVINGAGLPAGPFKTD